MQPSRAWVSWSSGKDCALALHLARGAGSIEVTGLLTTLDASSDRVTMHRVRRTLLAAQADALGLSLHVVELPQSCDNATYERRMASVMADAAAEGIEHIVFGDLFLEDIRAYREDKLAPSGIRPLFPLWRRPTETVATDIVGCGIRALITCVDTARAPAALVGRWYDEELLAGLPAGVDPCGENGEFHTFVVDGPGFAHPLDIKVGETVERDGFAFADVIPADARRSADVRTPA